MLQCFSTWNSLLRAVALHIHVTQSFRSVSPSATDKCKGWHWCDKPRTPEELSAIRNVIIKSAQSETYAEEFSALEGNRNLPQSSQLVKLNPMIQDSLLKVGGRLTHAPLNQAERNPLIVGKESQVTKLLIQQHHKEVKHQGCKFTDTPFPPMRT